MVRDHKKQYSRLKNLAAIPIFQILDFGSSILEMLSISQTSKQALQILLRANFLLKGCLVLGYVYIHENLILHETLAKFIAGT